MTNEWVPEHPSPFSCSSLSWFGGLQSGSEEEGELIAYLSKLCFLDRNSVGADSDVYWEVILFLHDSQNHIGHERDEMDTPLQRAEG